MKRLLSPSPNGGLPYVNSDFNDILQTEHIKAYSGHLNSINDRQFGETGTLDRGIILLGCTPYNATPTSTTFDFTRSLVYIPGLTGAGDFYEANSAIANSAYIVNSNLVYITVTNDEERRKFRSGENNQVLIKGYFTVTTTPPATPYIEFLNGKTRRNYKRVLKYALANTNDVMMTGNTSDFDLGTGLGVGNMYGFALCNGLNGTYDLTGRFVIGFKNGAATTPVDNTTIWDSTTSTQTYNSTDIMNYGAIGNKGGGRLTDGLYYPSKVLIIPELPSHDHGSITGDPNVDLNHSHGTGQDAGSNFVFAGGGANTGTTGGGDRGLDQTSRRYAAGTGFINNAVASNANLQHRHGIPAQGNSYAHEIRSPYLVLAYYQKITI
jgi:hypothetical protein